MEDAFDNGINPSSNHKTSPITCDNIRESPSISNKLAITANEHSYANEDVVEAKNLHKWDYYDWVCFKTTTCLT